MHAVALLALGASVVSAAGVTSIISPSGTAPASCATSYPGVFQATVVALSAGMKEKRQAMNATSASALNLTLANGILKDSPLGRFGYIASNYQLQFDANVPQAGALYTAGFSVCANGSLALGPSNVFYECLSGDFYNLYSQSIGGQCQPILINALSASGSSSASTTTTAVSQISDGQVQATTAATSAPKVSQITDGQIQATTPVTSAPKTTSSVPKITQITDGQIQATTPVTSVPKTTTTSSSSVARISQITDGQIQATTPATSAPALFTGAAVMPKVGGEFFAAAAGVAALALF